MTFYSENSISPVSQDIADIQKHFRKREALYRHLGIPPSFLHEKTILEIGPGGGHNALFMLHCAPHRYFLIDGNYVGAQETRNRLAVWASQNSIDTNIEV